MAPRKLSDSDKRDIIELYKQPNQTTSTLAGQYGVSNSTISRILKTSLPPEEYSELISQKRMAGSSDKTDAPTKRSLNRKAVSAEITTASDDKNQRVDVASLLNNRTANEPAEPTRVDPPKLKTAAQKEEALVEPPKTGTSRRRRRSRSKRTDDDEQLLLATEITPEGAPVEEPVLPIAISELDSTIAAGVDEIDDDDDDLAGLDETLGDDFGDDDLDDDLEDGEEDADTLDLPKPKLQPLAAMAIMPLGEAVLPKPCYLVVDMRSELITRPLSDFADLGQIPSSEEKAKTLPVFDNHRVARRFSRNKQRVIKVPDGNLITRTSPYLKAKGITRLLVDGQVFDLASRD